MSALFLLMMPAIALATYRVLSARRAPRAAAAAGAVALAALLTVVPAYALRTKPATGEPLETPVGPAFARTGEGVELVVDFGAGWSAPTVVSGQTVRTLAGRGTLAVGPLQTRRPPAELAFEAAAASEGRLEIRFEGRVLADVPVGPEPRSVEVDVPEGVGPAVLELEVTPSGELTVPQSTVRATAGGPR